MKLNIPHDGVFWLIIKSQPYAYMLPFTDAFDNDERETKEIEVIIPEKKEKIADNKDMQQETVRDKL